MEDLLTPKSCPHQKVSTEQRISSKPRKMEGCVLLTLSHSTQPLQPRDQYGCPRTPRLWCVIYVCICPRFWHGLLPAQMELFCAWDGTTSCYALTRWLHSPCWTVISHLSLCPAWHARSQAVGGAAHWLEAVAFISNLDHGDFLLFHSPASFSLGFA